MSNYTRRVPPPSQQYYAVPQSPRSAGPSRQSSQNRSYSNQSMAMPQPTVAQSSYRPRRDDHDDTTRRVATGQIGGGYGPYSHHPNVYANQYSTSRFSNNGPAPSAAPSATHSEISVVTTREKAGTAPMLGAAAPTNTVGPYLWDTKDPDLDDALHNPDPVRDAALDRSFTLFSARGWMNASALFLLVAGLLVLFAGYPIILFVRDNKPVGPGFNLGGINRTGQVPDLPHMPTLIDTDTPSEAMTRTGTDGKTYNLVFSDEFNQAGRTFWPGDDPYWEAVNLNYWPTGDLEWYDPQALVTEDGKLVITMDETPIANLSFRSGMLQSWNKLCFTTGYIEVNMSMPGTPLAPGLWPGVWTMGNLGRAGYGATTEGMWPYSYDTCDVGTFPNQTNHDGTPVAARTGGTNGGELSFLPGQRVSACTCPGSDHPGPDVSVGRGVPEIDILETQVDVSRFIGQVSQSYQTAPYNDQYEFDNNSDATTIYDTSITRLNGYKGGQYQQAISALTDISSNNYNNMGYATYGYEWWSDPNDRDAGYIAWFSQGKPSWKITAATIGPDPVTEVSQRLIPEEPMYIIFNLGMSPSFQAQDFKHLTFPSKMYIDYVRVYQRSDVKGGVTCDPSSRPTSDYITRHANAYNNPNLTTWDSAGYTFPRNSKYDGC
ncbi:glycoside hydrolase family 16 protein [Phanerochaete sordida]|uniref:Glycoside hydrolase family 16 protein n=1 Tax=Phanerochaete sordida TaxID=48140 RepID=A0A9P3G3E2_9APHY|nr:glycoside hydrolase family 16 protein [Phanerochaete sordida]